MLMGYDSTETILHHNLKGAIPIVRYKNCAAVLAVGNMGVRVTQLRVDSLVDNSLAISIPGDDIAICIEFN